MEALFRLQWHAFTTWYQERDDTSIFNKDDLVEIMKEVQNVMGDKEQFIETFNKFRQELQTVEE